MALTTEDIKRAVKALDENHVPLESRVIYCPYCETTHSWAEPFPEDCHLRALLLEEIDDALDGVRRNTTKDAR